MPTKLGI